MEGIHEENARRFAAALRGRLGGSLHAVLLFGSVARGQAKVDSDVDLLVITGVMPASAEINDIAYEIDFAARFATFLTPLKLSIEQLEHYISLGDPFLERVLSEGKILYDDGTLRELLDRIVTARG